MWLFVEFTPHQREVFCVFSGQGVVGLRRYLNNEGRLRAVGEINDDEVTLTGADNSQTVPQTPIPPILNGEDETEADEELEDAEDSQLETAVATDGELAPGPP